MPQPHHEQHSHPQSDRSLFGRGPICPQAFIGLRKGEAFSQASNHCRGRGCGTTTESGKGPGTTRAAYISFGSRHVTALQLKDDRPNYLAPNGHPSPILRRSGTPARSRKGPSPLYSKRGLDSVSVSQDDCNPTGPASLRGRHRPAGGPVKLGLFYNLCIFKLPRIQIITLAFISELYNKILDIFLLY